MDVLRAEKLVVRRGGETVLQDVSFTVGRGECLGILGPNGGGKTTLVRTLLGMLRPQSGQVWTAPGEVFGYVPQVVTFDRSFPIQVCDCVLLGHLPARPRWGYRFQAHEREHAEEALVRLGVWEKAQKRVDQLSEGELRKVLIARALMHHPSILILDEPTAGIDSASSRSILSLLEELRGTLSILMITHHPYEARSLFDQVLYVDTTAHLHHPTDLGQGPPCPGCTGLVPPGGRGKTNA